MDWHSKTILQTARDLKTSVSDGLSPAEARRRLDTNGPNTLGTQKRTSLVMRFIMQFKDFMVLLLIAAAAVSFLTSVLGGEKDIHEPLMIIAIVLFNAVVGVIQESKAEHALEALKKESTVSARAVRGGRLCEIPAAEIVPGDILHISQGDIIPADCRICECMGFTVSEAALTGESLPVAKSPAASAPETPLAERSDMVYMGTHVLTGRAVCMVTATGMNTEMGKIADILSKQDIQETPLQKKLGETGKMLGLGAVSICAVIFILGLVQKRPPLDMLMTSVSLAVAAIPEGLPAIVTVMLAIGVRKMAKEKAVVRRLSAVETLGSASVICTDKTGTLTLNKMSVDTIYGDDKNRVLRAAALCTNTEKGSDGWIGDPTETALNEAAGYNEDVDMPRCDEISFTPERRMMTGIFVKNGRYTAISKGAPETILEKCCFKNDISTPFTPNDRQEAANMCADLESKGLRLLAVAEKPLGHYPCGGREIERDMCFLGMIGLMDKPRPEAADAVKMCRAAGIRPIMITGDSPVTAKTIGEYTGIKTNRVITGSELDKMTDDELKAALCDTNIFARTSPEHKLRIVETLKNIGCISAMTGDACNDAPALKAADIGCAMGLCGTEAAREAADIILMDDNFATIVKAVKYGRGIYANIKKAVHFLLSSNVGEIITVFSSMCFGGAAPLVPVQLLWINLVTDSLPAIALGLEPVEADVMLKKPSDTKSIFGKDGWISIAAEGIMIGMLALIAGIAGRTVFGSEAVSQTMNFCTLSISQLVHAFNMRSERSLFKISPFSNPWLIGAFLVGCALQTGVVVLPVFNDMFSTVPLNAVQWLCTLLLCLVPMAVSEAEKFFTAS